MKNLSLGIIGAGAIMRERHWPNLAKIPGVQIAAVCNSTQESARRFLDFAGCDADVVANWMDVINHPKVSVIWIAAPPCLHKPAAVAAIASGKPVFCQARMAMNLSDALEMRESHKARPDVVAAFCRAPFGLEVGPTVKEIIRSGRYGRPVSLIFKHLTSAYADPKAPAHWRQRTEINGINFLTCGIFAEVLFDWFGAPCEISARGGVVHQLRGDYRVTLPDYAHVLAAWSGGMTGTLTWSGIHYGNERPELCVQCERARIIVKFQPDELMFSEHPAQQPQTLEIPPEKKGGWRVEEDFIRAVRGENVSPGVDFDEAVRYMRFTQAVVDSIKQNGKTITLAET